MENPKQRALYESVGLKIRERRKRLDLSQEDLAGSVGMSRTSITNVETGRQHPPLHQLLEIAEALKIDLRELVPSAEELGRVSTVEVAVGSGRQIVSREIAALVEEFRLERTGGDDEHR